MVLVRLAYWYPRHRRGAEAPPSKDSMTSAIANRLWRGKRQRLAGLIEAQRDEMNGTVKRWEDRTGKGPAVEEEELRNWLRPFFCSPRRKIGVSVKICLAVSLEVFAWRSVLVPLPKSKAVGFILHHCVSLAPSYLILDPPLQGLGDLLVYQSQNLA